MSDCEEKIYSNDYVDFIISKDVLDVIDLSSDCIQRIDEEKDTYFYPRSFFRIFDFPADSYASVPKCYGLLDETALEVSGILKLQQQPALALKGQGVMIGFIDTGIDYRNPVFQYSDGTTRIYRIWDQTIRDGTKPEGIAYGSEYKTEQINAALRAENPLETVPSMDTNGHGTFVAGVACGSEDVEDNFIGAAPFSEIAVVKLKEAKTYLREFYFIPDSVPAYQENDIMMAVSYLDRLAKERDMPLVICIALGSNMGNRGKDGQLATYLDIVSRRRKRCSVAAVGNEANARHHFLGKIQPDMEYESVEVSVEENMPGFFIEMWANAPELYAVSVSSPSAAKSALSERWKTGVCLYFRADKSQHRLPADGQAAGKPAYLFTFFKRSAGDLDDQRVSAEHCDRGLQYVASHAEFYEWKCFFPAVKSESYDHRAG